jgi:hypothetical protein
VNATEKQALTTPETIDPTRIIRFVAKLATRLTAIAHSASNISVPKLMRIAVREGLKAPKAPGQLVNGSLEVLIWGCSIVWIA